MGKFIRELRNSWSKNTTGVAGTLLTLITGLLTMAGGVLLYYDLLASYHGWGRLVETDMNLPHSTVLALTVTALPTLVQLAWSMAKVAGHELGEHPGVNVLFWVMLAIDTALDLNQVVTGTAQSWAMSIIVVIIGFGFGSEFLLSFMGSSFIGMVRSAIASPRLWNPNKDSERSPLREDWQASRTDPSGKPWPTTSRRSSSKTRAQGSNKGIFDGGRR